MRIDDWNIEEVESCNEVIVMSKYLGATDRKQISYLQLRGYVILHETFFIRIWVKLKDKKKEKGR